MKILDIPQSTTSQHLSKLKRNVLHTEKKWLRGILVQSKFKS
ncbi:ArsR family transcriptional regulator [Bacillus cereus]